MRRARLALATLAFVVVGCGSLGGPERLIADLQVRGLPAAMGTAYGPGALFEGNGMSVCVGDESVSTYTFADAAAAAEGATTVNRDDPWQVGNAIVEWIGPPRFWLRDRVIVVYVGGDVGLDAALRGILGQPFAEGHGGGRGLPAFEAARCAPAAFVSPAGG